MEAKQTTGTKEETGRVIRPGGTPATIGEQIEADKRESESSFSVAIELSKVLSPPRLHLTEKKIGIAAFLIPPSRLISPSGHTHTHTHNIDRRGSPPG